MEKEMLSVWDWIAQKCHDKGWHSSANVAEFLATQEKEVWGRRNREFWETHIKEFQMLFEMAYFPANCLVGIARYRDLKVGCKVSGYNCEDCALGKLRGVCNQKGSISHFWQYVLEMDSGEKVDETYQETMKKHMGQW